MKRGRVVGFVYRFRRRVEMGVEVSEYLLFVRVVVGTSVEIQHSISQDAGANAGKKVYGAVAL
jgi:hypothetical protein